ncbi:MAG TPA: TetR/AcrR family transcriptional regulator [Aeromicrobium sp.]|nr:TetR/AcrR family transcriptional regulator [Aeromicrobium sp.]
MLAVRHKDSTETRILDAARDSIIDIGWKRTTLTEVARRAGLSRMTVYRRYPDAVAIYADLMTREWADQAPTGVDAADTTAHGIAVLMAERLDILRSDPLFQRLLQLDPDILLPYLTERRGRTQQAVLTLLVPLIEHGQKVGTIRSGSAELLARSILLAAQGFLVSAQTMTDAAVQPDDLHAELIALVERYLRP